MSNTDIKKKAHELFTEHTGIKTALERGCEDHDE